MAIGINYGSRTNVIVQVQGARGKTPYPGGGEELLHAIHNEGQMRVGSVVRVDPGSRPARCWPLIVEELDPRPLWRRSQQTGYAHDRARSAIQPLLRLSLIRHRIGHPQSKNALIEGKTLFRGRNGDSAVVDAEKKPCPALPEGAALSG